MEDFIRVYPNSFDDEFCNEATKFCEFMVENGFYRSSLSEKVETKLRSDQSVFIPGSYYDFVKNHGIPSQVCPEYVCHQYMNTINQLADSYAKDFSIVLSDPLVNPGFKLHQVKEGQGYHVFHCEADSRDKTTRVLVYMTYLEEPEEGGETEFLFQKKRILPKRGTTLIWPAQFTHLHRGNPVLKGQKTYATGWYLFS